MLRQGLLCKQIAYDLGVGETTVKAHVSGDFAPAQGFSARTAKAVSSGVKIDFDAILSQHLGGDPN